MCISMYVYVLDQYLHVLHVLDHWGTETTTASPKHPLVTPHPGGPTQGTPGQVANHCLTPSLSLPSTRFFYFFMKNQCLALSCHGHRNGQYPPKGPKLCPIALPQALHRTQSRVLRSDVYLWLEGASKMTPPHTHFCVLVRLATAVESVRIVQAGSNLAQSPSHAHCARLIRAC
jgi:hypothetical protein